MKCEAACRSCLAGLAERIAEAAGAAARCDPSYGEGCEGVSARAREASLSVLGRRFAEGRSVPTRVATRMLRAVRAETSVPDVFSTFKEEEYRRGEAASRVLAQGGSRDDVKGHMRLSLEGNRIDFFRDLDEVEAEWRGDAARFSSALSVDDSDRVVEAVEMLARGDLQGHVLVLADNCGELPFDAPLLEGLERRGVRCVYAVKGKPSQNDLTIEDFKRFGAGFDSVVDNGTDWVGTELECCSAVFAGAWDDAALVLSKGMANLETLTEYPQALAGKKVFFMLVAKCEPVANYLGVEVGSPVIYDAARLRGNERRQ